MADIAEPLRPARALDAHKFGPLKTFSCGRQGQTWERFVNGWARDAYRGANPREETVLVLEDDNHKLVGISGFLPKPLPTTGGKLVANAHQINVVATDRLYRGKRLQDGSRPGDVLMKATLERIKTACRGRMPYVWALVSEENDRSLALFDRHGFGAFPYKGGDTIRVRPPSKLLPVVALPFTRSIARALNR